VRKTLMITLVVLASAMWLAAQDSGQMGKSPGTTTIQGCLSSANGHYQVTDSGGKVYQLSYDPNKLAHHVGHEIKVAGTVDASGAQPVVKVKTVTHIADTCIAGK
jgi:hypothetical protein